MRERRFEDMYSIDKDIRQAMVEDIGRSPDNFIEDGQGGGLDADLLAQESPTEEQALIDDLDRTLRTLDPTLLMEGEDLRHD
jgi:hypothetical protein